MSSTNKEGRPPKYDPSFKIAVAREYLTSNLGFGKLAEKHGLNGADTVRGFVRWYKKKYPDGQLRPIAPQAVDTNKRDGETEKALQHANLKIEALETLIEIAQKELGIDIVKKFGTKQSMK